LHIAIQPVHRFSLTLSLVFERTVRSYITIKQLLDQVEV